MRKTALFTVLLLSLFVVGVSAEGKFFLYERNDAYWIFEQPKPSFQVLVPSTGVAYLQSQRYGESLLEISLRENGPKMTIGGIGQTGLDIPTVRSAVIDHWRRVLSNIRVTNNSEITTGTNTKATFYSITGTSPLGQTVMVRVILFQRNKDIAYITYTLLEREYVGQDRDIWIQAVNSFEWQ